MPKLMKIAVLTLGLSLMGMSLMQSASQAGERGGGMMTLRPAIAMRMQENEAVAPLRLLHKYLWLAGTNTKRECNSNSDCKKGDICCKVSGLETYCASADECYGEPMKD